ncbi:MAG: histidinol-phosphate aminotransferase [Enterobacterales bacterium]|jgi:histidinol-phosphate aminotransferase
MTILSTSTSTDTTVALTDSAQTLKLNFNERSDFKSPLEEQFQFDAALWQYPDRQPLEALIAEKFALKPSEVICTNGGDEAIMILMRLIKESSQVILPLPAFSQYTWGIDSWKLEATIIDGKTDLSIDTEATLAAINTSSDAVVIITRPNNPSGEMIAMTALKEIIETAKENKSWVFLDEAYIEFSDGCDDGCSNETTKLLLKQYDNLVILRTLSKAYGLAGIRLGYLLGSESLIAEFDKRCAPFNIATPTLTIAAAALSDAEQQDVKNYCLRIRENRQQIFADLRANNINVLPSQANFLVLQLPNLQSSAVESFLAKNNIMVRSFTGSMSNCLRITIPYDIDKLSKLLQQALYPDLVCLDMDGVLIDTSGSYDATVIATVKTLSGTTITTTDIEQLKSTAGFNNDWVLSQKLLSDLGVELELDEIINVFQRIYLGDSLGGGLVQNETIILSQSLTELIKASSTTFAIVTGRPLMEAKAGAKFIGLENLDLISLDCVENAKPSPEGINRLQNKYSTSSWMCGDNPDDMQAALASNSLAIGITGNSNKSKQQALYQAGADIVLNDINELEKWLCPLK